MTVLSVVLISLGVFFLVMGAVGLVRFTDYWSRIHAAGKCDTLGSLLLLSGLTCYGGATFASVKILVIGLFIFMTSPTATHAIARAAFQHEEARCSEENR